MRTARGRAALAAVVTGALAGVALPTRSALAATAGVPAQAVSFRRWGSM